MIGVEGLRVADASVMPTVPGGNTNLPAIMVGEKAADLIRGRSLPRAELAGMSRAAKEPELGRDELKHDLLHHGLNWGAHD